MIESYHTLAGSVRGFLTVKGSKFIASVSPVESQENALGFIKQVCDEFSDATHNAYAYKVGLGSDRIEYSNDDREPSGSAGPPILNALDSFELDNVAAVVTRYFGGTKLGIGGLVRAYRGSVEAALTDLKVKKCNIFISFKLDIPYDFLGNIYREVGSSGGEIIKAEYGQTVFVFCSIPIGTAEMFIDRVTDVTRGKGKVIRIK